MSAVSPEFSPPASLQRSRPWARRYWAAVYLVRRLTLLALMLWAAVACVGAMTGPHPVAAGAGLLCALAVLYVQGRWVWRRHRNPGRRHQSVTATDTRIRA